MNEYQEQIIDHYKNPRNYGIQDPKDYTLYSAQNLSCGDEINIYLKLSNNKIVDARFTGSGCSIAVATASLLTENIINKDISILDQIDEKYIYNLIGFELTTSRRNCALLTLHALNNIKN